MTPFHYGIDHVYAATQADTIGETYTVYRHRGQGSLPRPHDLIVEGWAYGDGGSLPSEGIALVDSEVRGEVRLGRERAEPPGDGRSVPAGGGFVAIVHTAGLSFGEHFATVRLRLGDRDVETGPIPFNVRPALTIPNAEPARICFVHAPKVGGTFQESILVNYMGIDNPPYSTEWRWETMLSDPNMVHPDFNGPYVISGHMFPRWKNISISLRERLTVVAGWRNIADAIVSIDDHIRNETHVWPWIYIGRRDRFLALSQQERFQMLVRYAAPWYINYYLSWLDIGVPIFARYEWMATDPRAFFEHLMQCIFGQVDETRLAQVLADSAPAEGRLRFNKGLNGRASELFSAETKALLEETLRQFYQPLDELIAELPWNGGAEASIALAMDRREFERRARDPIPVQVPMR